MRKQVLAICCVIVGSAGMLLATKASGSHMKTPLTDEQLSLINGGDGTQLYCDGGITGCNQSNVSCPVGSIPCVELGEGSPCANSPQKKVYQNPVGCSAKTGAIKCTPFVYDPPGSNAGVVCYYYYFCTCQESLGNLDCFPASTRNNGCTFNIEYATACPATQCPNN
jgi:hypothetical protein